MFNIKLHIVVLCVASVYFVSVKALNLAIEDVSSNAKHSDAIVQWLKRIQSRENQRHFNNKHRKVKPLVLLLDKINDEEHGKLNLRDSSIATVQNFLQNLNSYINQNTHNFYYEKRGDCKSGFGHPGSKCKKNRFRRQNRKKDKINYAQHMLIERARFKSSSESNSDDSDAPLKHQKSRFQIVDNLKKGRGRQESSSDEEDSDFQDETLQEKDADKVSSADESDRKTVDSDSSEEKSSRDTSDSDSHKRKKTKNKMDTEFLYLQGTRLEKPNLRLGTPVSKGRSRREARREFNYRLPYFMPKRFKWDPGMYPYLDELWTVGIQSYNTRYKKQYAGFAPY